MNSNRLFWLTLLLSLLIHLMILVAGLFSPTSLLSSPDTALRTVSVELQALQATDDSSATQTANQEKTAQVSLRRQPLPASILTRKRHNKPASRHDKEESSAPKVHQPVPEESPEPNTTAQQPILVASKEEASTPANTVKTIVSEPSSEEKEKDTAIATLSHPDEKNGSPSSSTEEKHGQQHWIKPPEPLRHFAQRATLNYQGFYGPIMAGNAELSFKRHKNSYELNIMVKPVVGSNLRYLSTGSFTVKQGLRPKLLQAWRGNQSKESAFFDRENQTLHYGTQAELTVPLEETAQDVFSLAFQLAYKGGKLGSSPLQITTGKKVYYYPMHPAGETDYSTRDGKIRAIVFRAYDQNDTFEFWLAPDFSNLPIRITRMDADNKIDLRASRIRIDDEEYWKLSSPPRKNANE